MIVKNKLSVAVNSINRLPAVVRPRVLTTLLRTAVPYVGTSKIRVEHLNKHQAMLAIKNRRKTRNHIGTPHAVAIALLAESATGFLVGMNVSDEKYVLIKKMNIDYTRRVQGGLTVKASLTDDQIQKMTNEDKGDVTVQVSVMDESHHEPVQCEMVWAWTRKKA